MFLIWDAAPTLVSLSYIGKISVLEHVYKMVFRLNICPDFTDVITDNKYTLQNNMAMKK